MKRSLGFALILSLAAAPGPLFAGDKGEKKDKKAEKRPKGQAPPKIWFCGNTDRYSFDHILELLEDIEDRLIETDTGEWTQEEQRQALEALKLQKAAADEIDKMIERLKKERQGSCKSGSCSKPGSSGASQAEGEKRGEKARGKSREVSQRSREQQRRDKERQRRSALEKARKSGPKTPSHLRRKSKNERERRLAKMRRGRGGALRSKSGAARSWGALPSKLHQDAEKTRSEPIPERFRALIEGYRKGLENKD